MFLKKFKYFIIYFLIFITLYTLFILYIHNILGLLNLKIIILLFKSNIIIFKFEIDITLTNNNLNSITPADFQILIEELLSN